VSGTPSFESCTGDVVKQIDLNAEVNQQTLDAANGNNAMSAAATELAPKAMEAAGVSYAIPVRSDQSFAR
jgi:hypothetical protein